MSNHNTQARPLIASQITTAKLLTIQIEVAAKSLARLMDELLGEEFKFSVSHVAEAEFILIGIGMCEGGSSRG